jgi:hypothetical protein
MLTSSREHRRCHTMKTFICKRNVCAATFDSTLNEISPDINHPFIHVSISNVINVGKKIKRRDNLGRHMAKIHNVKLPVEGTVSRF